MRSPWMDMKDGLWRRSWRCRRHHRRERGGRFSRRNFSSGKFSWTLFLCVWAGIGVGVGVDWPSLPARSEQLRTTQCPFVRTYLRIRIVTSKSGSSVRGNVFSVHQPENTNTDGKFCRLSLGPLSHTFEPSLFMQRSNSGPAPPSGCGINLSFSFGQLPG